jgi:hypothetical protein
MDKNSILNALKGNEDQTAMDEKIGMVVVNEELLQQVSGGYYWGRYYSLSAECMGFSCGGILW